MLDAKKKLFDVEHALLMYAHSFVILPAVGIYDAERLKEFAEVTKKCHIYVIGETPTIALKDVQQDGCSAKFYVTVGSDMVELNFELPEGANVMEENDRFRFVSPEGREFAIEDLDIAMAVRRKIPVHFNVLYIGQAFGSAGERSALDRLKKHETLQKIALNGISHGSSLTLLLLEILPATGLVTVMNPFAQNQKAGNERIRAGIDKLFGTTEKERVALYEASLIRYFQPRYNKEFKDSFPSTNMKVLKDCYSKDFSAVIAEINFDDLPWNLRSELVPSKPSHIATHNLHTTEERSIFFSS
ncbi:hypothetical protein ABC383_06225 [Noviherbaspirillum sp. 1P10PC]|uniref:hypothetical protein n=1 Tax=Noviherbaspirillum sp. 1P10PC TaxID=3132292 RepID=UPI0039A15F96